MRVAMLALVALGCNTDPIAGKWDLVSSANAGEVWAPPAWQGVMLAGDGAFSRTYSGPGTHINSGIYEVRGDRVTLEVLVSDHAPLMLQTFDNTWQTDGDRLTFRGDRFEEIWVKAP